MMIRYYSIDARIIWQSAYSGTITRDEVEALLSKSNAVLTHWNPETGQGIFAIGPLAGIVDSVAKKRKLSASAIAQLWQRLRQFPLNPLEM